MEASIDFATFVPKQMTQAPSSRLANLLWLTEPPGLGRALIISPAYPVFPHWALSRFDEVDTLRTAEVAGGAGTEQTDLVVLEVDGTLDGPATDVDRLLSAVHRLLGREGQLLIIGSNPRWFRAPRVTRRGTLESVSTRRLEQRLAALGFTDLFAFHLTPSYESPWSIIPRHSRAAAAEAVVSGRLSASSRIRVFLSRAGLDDVLHPGRMVLAKRC